MILLNTNEQALRNRTEELLNWVTYHFARNCAECTKAEYFRNFAEMTLKAHELHMSLRARGLEPKHSKQMLRNRGVKPTNMEFYFHVHSVEDLIAQCRSSMTM